MNRLGTALFAAVEAVIAVAVGLGVALVPFALLWGVEYGLQEPWSIFWAGASDVWLIGHGVNVTFLLNAATAKATGIAGAGDPIVVSLAALGFAVITAWIGARAGRRFAETAHRWVGLIVSTLVVAALSAVIAIGATSSASRPSVWQAIVFPALWFGVPALVGAEIARRRRGLDPDPLTWRLLDELDRIPARWRAAIAASLRGGAAVMAIVVAAAGLLVAVSLLFSYAEIITLYERSHAGTVGGMAITVGELAFVPDFIGWATSWIIGPGFAIGAGSNVSPIQTSLGPIPGIPAFGALPVTGHSFGFAWILVPVIAGFLVAAFLRRRLANALGPDNTVAARIVAGAGMGIVAGAIAGTIAILSSGSLGPGRLATAGPSFWPVAGFAALEVGLPAIIALAIGGDLVSMPTPMASSIRDRITDRRAARADQDDVNTAEEANALSSAPTLAEALADHDHDHAGDPVGTNDRGILGALGRAGEGRTTDVHRFAPAETQAMDVDAPDADDDETTGLKPAAWAQSVMQRAGRGARAGAVRVRDRLERDRSAEGTSDEEPAGKDEPVASARVATGAQAGFPWRTEEFVEADHQEQARRGTGTAEPAADEDESDEWENTGVLREDEVPWWKQPKGEG